MWTCDECQSTCFLLPNIHCCCFSLSFSRPKNLSLFLFQESTLFSWMNMEMVKSRGISHATDNPKTINFSSCVLHSIMNEDTQLSSFFVYFYQIKKAFTFLFLQRKQPRSLSLIASLYFKEVQLCAEKKIILGAYIFLNLSLEKFSNIWYKTDNHVGFFSVCIFYLKINLSAGEVNLFFTLAREREKATR